MLSFALQVYVWLWKCNYYHLLIRQSYLAQPQARSCSNSLVAGLGSHGSAKPGIKPASEPVWTAGPREQGERRWMNNLGNVKAVFPVQVWQQSWRSL